MLSFRESRVTDGTESSVVTIGVARFIFLDIVRDLFPISELELSLLETETTKAVTNKY